MASPGSSTPSLTPSRSPSPEPPVQPDHFYGNDNPQLPTPLSDGRAWLSPADDPLAQRGIPVFKPTMDEFRDFEQYMNKVEAWGMRSGIVKVIPPKEWTDALPSLIPQLANIKMKNPIEQHMFGQRGLFRQENIEKRRIMSVREWSELCSKEDLRAPGVDDVALHARATNGSAKPRTRRGRTKTREPATAEPEMTPEVRVKEEHEEDEGVNIAQIEDSVGWRTPALTPPRHGASLATASADPQHEDHADSAVLPSEASSSRHPSVAIEGINNGDMGEKPRSKRRTTTKEVREAHLAERAAKDREFLETFDPHSDWLPPNTTQFDYTPEFCKELERRYWRNCGFGKSAWYGADLQGSLFTHETTSWNVGHLNSALSRILPSSGQGLPGVNTPYLYFGMWRATFAWHVEDMDLFSINYIHFGAPKFWYAVPQARAVALEQAMKGYFPRDTAQCPQFLRHKSFLASPSLLSQSSCRPNCLVQHEGEFVITYPKGYHAGFNLGFNCAESVNFALESWLDLGRKARVCECVSFSVRIDVGQLLADREAERAEAKAQAIENETSARVKPERKRKSDTIDGEPQAKKVKAKAMKKAPEASSSKTIIPKITLKLGPIKPKELDTFPCCLCVSQSAEGLLSVHDPPIGRKEGESGLPGERAVWMAHEQCANVVPETWVDDIETGTFNEDGTRQKEKVIFGVGGIVKDRWNLKCSACTKPKHKVHGAPIQCTKGKCPKAFHVSCARDGGANGILWTIVGEVEKDVVLLSPQTPASTEIRPEAMAVETQASGAASGSADGSPDNDSNTDVLKVIKKTEVEVLCPQHNPAITEAKKAQKQEKIKNDLLALPDMSRIKLRVSAGVFEVSLVRVIPETKSVEVLWDRGVKREFKWGSVVFGATDGVVGQKPSEVALEADRTLSMTPVPQLTAATFPPLQNPAPVMEFEPLQPYPSVSPFQATPSQHHYSHPSQYQQPSSYHYNAPSWLSQYQNGLYPPRQPPYPSHQDYQLQSGIPYHLPSSQTSYGGYNMVPQASMSGDQHQPPAPIRRGLQWQTPYTGPRYALPPQVTPTAHLSTGGFSPFPVQEPPVLQDPKLAHSDTPQTASTLLAEPTSGIQ